MSASSWRDVDENWIRSDRYHNSFLHKPDDALEHALKHSDESELPRIAVSAAHGKLLNLLVKTINAKRILEVGTLGGYSAIWLARGLPEGGKLIAAEIDPKHAQVARENIEYAGLSSKVEVRVGAGRDILKALPTEEKFDLVFIDADKPSNALYYKEARRLTRKGSIIIIDNVVWGGLPADPTVSDEVVEGIRELLRTIQADEGADATTIGTVGENRYDGFTYVLVL